MARCVGAMGIVSPTWSVPRRAFGPTRRATPTPVTASDAFPAFPEAPGINRDGVVVDLGRRSCWEANRWAATTDER